MLASIREFPRNFPKSSDIVNKRRKQRRDSRPILPMLSDWGSSGLIVLILAIFSSGRIGFEMVAVFAQDNEEFIRVIPRRISRYAIPMIDVQCGFAVTARLTAPLIPFEDLQSTLLPAGVAEKLRVFFHKPPVDLIL
jgi:hypothetical protein